MSYLKCLNHILDIQMSLLPSHTIAYRSSHRAIIEVIIIKKISDPIKWFLRRRKKTTRESETKSRNKQKKQTHCHPHHWQWDIIIENYTKKIFCHREKYIQLQMLLSVLSNIKVIRKIVNQSIRSISKWNTDLCH